MWGCSVRESKSAAIGKTIDQLKWEKGAKQEEAKEGGRHVPMARCDLEMAALPLKVNEGGVEGPGDTGKDAVDWSEKDLFGDGPR